MDEQFERCGRWAALEVSFPIRSPLELTVSGVQRAGIGQAGRAAARLAAGLPGHGPAAISRLKLSVPVSVLR